MSLSKVVAGGNVSVNIGMPNKSTADYSGRIQNFLDEYLGDENEPVPFGGRLNEIKELNSWLHGSDNANTQRLLLTAPAGRGKSALISRWLDELNDDVVCIFFPISIRFRTNLANVIFPTIASRLAFLFGEDAAQAATLTPEECAAEITGYLRRPLPDGKTLLLVLDGADEASGWTVGPDILPSRLPNSNRILISARTLAGDPDGEEWLRQFGWERAGKAKRLWLGPLSLSEVASAVSRRADATEIPSQLAIDLHRVSEGDPLLVQLYVMRLWASSDENAHLDQNELSGIEPGLKPFLDRWWQDQKVLWGDDQSVRSVAARELIKLLACALGPICRQELLELSDPLLSLTLRAFDEGMMPLRRLVVGDGEDQGYVFSHPRLAEYFFDQAKRWGEVGEVEARFVSWGDRSFSALQNEIRTPSEMPPYLIQYYRVHLEKAGLCFDRADTLVSLDWLSVWETIEQGSYIGFLSDIDAVWAAARRENLQQTNLPEQNVRFALELRCALIRSSIFTVAGTLPRPLVLALLSREIWSVSTFLASVSRISDISQRVSLLVDPALNFSGRDSERVASAAFTNLIMLKDADERAERIADLGSRLPSVFVREAQEIAFSARPIAMARALFALGVEPNADLLKDLVADIESLRNPFERLSTVVTFLENAPSSWHEALLAIFDVTLKAFKKPQTAASIEIFDLHADFIERGAAFLEPGHRSSVIQSASLALRGGSPKFLGVLLRCIDGAVSEELKQIGRALVLSIAKWATSAKNAERVICAFPDGQCPELGKALVLAFKRWKFDDQLSFVSAVAPALTVNDSIRILAFEPPKKNNEQWVKMLEALTQKLSDIPRAQFGRRAFYLTIRSIFEQTRENTACDQDIALILCSVLPVFSDEHISVLFNTFLMTPSSSQNDAQYRSRVQLVVEELRGLDRDLSCLFLCWLVAQKNASDTHSIDLTDQSDWGTALDKALDHLVSRWCDAKKPCGPIYPHAQTINLLVRELDDERRSSLIARCLKAAEGHVSAGRDVCAAISNHLSAQEALSILTHVEQDGYAIPEFKTIAKIAQRAPSNAVADLLARLFGRTDADQFLPVIAEISIAFPEAKQKVIFARITLRLIKSGRAKLLSPNLPSPYFQNLQRTLRYLPEHLAALAVASAMEMASKLNETSRDEKVISLMLDFAPNLPRNERRKIIDLGQMHEKQNINEKAAILLSLEDQPEEAKLLQAIGQLTAGTKSFNVRVLDKVSGVVTRLVTGLSPRGLELSVKILQQQSTEILAIVIRNSSPSVAAAVAELALGLDDGLDQNTIRSICHFLEVEPFPAQSLLSAIINAAIRHRPLFQQNDPSSVSKLDDLSDLISLVFERANLSAMTDLLGLLADCPPILRLKGLLVVVNLEIDSELEDRLYREAIEVAAGLKENAASLKKIADHLLQVDCTDAKTLRKLAQAALTIEDKVKRDALLDRLLVHLSEDDLVALLQSVRSIRDDVESTLAFVETIELSTDHSFAFSEAQSVAINTVDVGERASGLAALIPYCAENQETDIVFEASKAARQVIDSQMRGDVLERIITDLSIATDKGVAELLAGIRSVEDQWIRTELIANIAPKITGVHLATCLEILNSTKDDDAYTKGFISIAPLVPCEWFDAQSIRRLSLSSENLSNFAHLMPDAATALKFVSKVGKLKPEQRADTLRRLAPALDEVSKLRLYAEAITECRLIENQYTASTLLVYLAKEAPPELVEKIIDAAICLKNNALATRVFEALAPRLSKSQSENFVTAVFPLIDHELSLKLTILLSSIAPDTRVVELLGHAQKIPDLASRAIVLARLGLRLIDILNAELAAFAFDVAEATVKKIMEPYARVSALSELSKILPQSRRPNLIPIIAGLENEDEQAACLVTLFGFLAPSDRRPAFDVISEMNSARARTDAIVEAARHLDNVGLNRALVISRGICPIANRIEAYGAILSNFEADDYTIRTILSEPLPVFARATLASRNSNAQSSADRAKLLASALENIQTLKTPFLQANLLASVVPELSAGTDDPAWKVLVETIGELKKNKDTASQVNLLLNRLIDGPEHILSSLLTAILGLLESDAGEQAILSLTPYLPLPDRVRAFVDITEISSRHRRHDLLFRLAPYFAPIWHYPTTKHRCVISGEVLATQYGYLPEHFADVLDRDYFYFMLAAFPDHAERADILRRIGATLTGPKQTWAFNMAIEAAKLVQSELLRADLLSEIAVQAPVKLSPELIESFECFRNTAVAAPILAAIAPRLPASSLKLMLNALNLLTEYDQKTDILRRLVHHLPRADADKAVRLARAIEDPLMRGVLLAKLSVRENGDAALALLDEVGTIVRNVRNSNLKEDAIGILAPHFTLSKRIELLAGIELETPEIRLGILRVLIPHLTTEDGRVALNIIAAERDEFRRAFEISEIVSVLPEGCLMAAFSMVNHLPSCSHKLDILSKLLPRLLLHDQSRALVNIETIEQNFARAELAISLAPRMHETLKNRIVGIALDAAAKVTDQFYRGHLLVRACSYLEDGANLDTLLRLCSACTDECVRAEILNCVVNKTMSSSFEHILVEIRNLEDPLNRGFLLGRLSDNSSEIYREILLNEAVENLSAIPDRYSRVLAFRELAVSSAKPNKVLIQAAIDNARAIPGDSHLVVTAKSLADRMTSKQRNDVTKELGGALLEAGPLEYLTEEKSCKSEQNISATQQRSEPEHGTLNLISDTLSSTETEKQEHLRDLVKKYDDLCLGSSSVSIRVARKLDHLNLTVESPDHGPKALATSSELPTDFSAELSDILHNFPITAIDTAPANVILDIWSCTLPNIKAVLSKTRSTPSRNISDIRKRLVNLEGSNDRVLFLATATEKATELDRKEIAALAFQEESIRSILPFLDRLVAGLPDGTLPQRLIDEAEVEGLFYSDQTLDRLARYLPYETLLSILFQPGRGVPANISETCRKHLDNAPIDMVYSVWTQQLTSLSGIHRRKFLQYLPPLLQLMKNRCSHDEATQIIQAISDVQKIWR